jgi:hypothetical protein
MLLLKILFRLLPWFLVIMLLMLWWRSQNQIASRSSDTETIQTTILEKTEVLGKLELVRYNFQEVTELKELSKEYFSFFKLGPDAKAVLISRGEAVACVDLTKLHKEDMLIEGDSIIVTLPEPELCYHKLDLQNTRLYSLETGYFTDRNAFIQKAYKSAEDQIRRASLNSGILEQARTNATLVLKPLLEEISGKKVIFRHELPATRIEMDY